MPESLKANRRLIEIVSKLSISCLLTFLNLNKTLCTDGYNVLILQSYKIKNLVISHPVINNIYHLSFLATMLECLSLNDRKAA